MTVAFLPSGDCGLTIEFGLEIDRDLSRQIMALRAAVEEAGFEGIVETVPTYRSLLVHYDPLRTSQADLIAVIEPLVAGLGDHPVSQARHWTLPICFEADFAPDLDDVAQQTGIEREAVIAMLTATEHFIYMLGFAPGLPYMGDLPQALSIPRREVPIPRAEKGSVLIATGLTIIYPVANPTGWHVVGRTPVPIFDVHKEDPVLFSPGDFVCFERVGLKDFEAIEQTVARGSYPHVCSDDREAR
jgi:inhibitor of KinA